MLYHEWCPVAAEQSTALTVPVAASQVDDGYPLKGQVEHRDGQHGQAEHVRGHAKAEQQVAVTHSV